MKVICVRKCPPKTPHPDLIKAVNDIQIGSRYTVVGEECTFYELEEFPHPRTILWEKEMFAIVSNIDEITFERNYNKQPV